MPTLQDRRVFEWRAPVRGLVLAASPRDLPPDALSECVNFDIDVEAGRLIRRDAWLSTAFAPEDGVIPTAVFEVPATNPPGAPSTPRCIVALVPGVSPGAGELTPYFWRLYMRPWWGGSSWIDSSWGQVGGIAQGFTSENPPPSVSASVVGQDGVYRVYLAYGVAATDPPNQNISLPIWLGFIPTTRVRFRDGDLPGDIDPGPNAFVATDLRLLPPPTSLLSVEVLDSGMADTVLQSGGRYYRLAYKYDGYQFGALSDSVAVDVPDEPGITTRVVIHVRKQTTIGPRPTHLLVFVQVAGKVIDGPGAYGLLDTVDLEKGPIGETTATAINSSVEDLDPCMYGTGQAGWNLVPVHDVGLVCFDNVSKYCVRVLGHFSTGADSGYDMLERQRAIVPGSSITRLLGRLTTEPTDFFFGTISVDRRSVVFSVNVTQSMDQLRAAFIPAGQIGELLSPSSAGVWSVIARVVEDAPSNTFTVFLDFALVGTGRPIVWQGYTLVLGALTGVVAGLSYVQASAPVFGNDAGRVPIGSMTVTTADGEFVEATMKATDGITMLFDSNPTPAYPAGTTTVNGELISYSGTGWARRVSYGGVLYHAVCSLGDIVTDLSGLPTYEELAQDTSLTPWVRASSIARVGRQHFAADLAIPDPTDRLNTAKDTIERFRIVGGNVTGEGQVAPDFFPPTSVSSAGEGTSPIQWMGEWFGRLVILTDESLYLAVPTSGGFLQPERRVRGYGCIGPRTAVLTPEGPMWLGRQGVVRFSGGSVDLLSAPLGSRLFLDSVEANGRTAMSAWDARRARYLLYLVTGGLHYVYAMGRSGAWSRYRFPFSLVALCQDSSSSGIPSAIAQFADDSYGLVQPDPNAILDLDLYQIVGEASYQEVEPAGGDRIAHVFEATVDHQGQVQLAVSVDGIAYGNVVFDSVRPAHGRMPVAKRGRTAKALVYAYSRGAYVDRVAFEAVPKGRVRS